MHVDRCHRSSPCSMTPSPSVDPRPQGRVRMQGGTIDLYRQGNRITRRRRTGALEDDCTAAHSHTCIHHMCVALSSQPPAVRCVARNIFTYIYIFIHAPSYTTGLSVPVVSSSVTGNLHPTPCIEWMQGKRGDPGCMAKVPTPVWLSIHCMR